MPRRVVTGIDVQSELTALMRLARARNADIADIESRLAASMSYLFEDFNRETFIEECLGLVPESPTIEAETATPVRRERMPRVGLEGPANRDLERLQSQGGAVMLAVCQCGGSYGRWLEGNDYAVCPSCAMYDRWHVIAYLNPHSRHDMRTWASFLAHWDTPLLPSTNAQQPSSPPTSNRPVRASTWNILVEPTLAPDASPTRVDMDNWFREVAPADLDVSDVY